MTNDLFSSSSSLSSSSSFSLFNPTDHHDHQKDDITYIEVRTSPMEEEVVELELELDQFFKGVESIKHELKELKTLYKRIQQSHQESKTNKCCYNSKFIKQLITSQMDSDVSLSLNKSKSIILGLDSLHRANVNNLKLFGYGSGSSSDRTRAFIVDELREKLKHTMERFNSLRERIGSEYYNKADDQTAAEILISSCSGCRERHDMERQQVGCGNSFNDIDQGRRQKIDARPFIVAYFATQVSWTLQSAGKCTRDDDHVKEEVVVVAVKKLDQFFKDVESIKHELKELNTLYKRIQHAHQESKTNKCFNSKFVKQLITSQMDSDVSLSLNKSKSIVLCFNSLHRANADNLKLPGCGPGSLSDRTRAFIVDELREKIKHTMERFNSLRERIGSEYYNKADTIERKYIVVTDEKAEDQTAEEILISSCSGCGRQVRHDIEMQQVGCRGASRCSI
ncbi:Syntaxin [Macleaya cordata]|uniref:Syntaxin n=1 Tax=Macleaya cordata TaxID=56857 RepID=A0A200Q9P1_MACCD|nr:Syntaxin [Macleaya cordata]